MSNFFSNNNQSNNIFSSASDVKEEDFFAIGEEKENKTEEKPLNEQYNGIKLNYQQVFIEAAESIRKELDNFKPERGCDGCSVKDCKIENKDIFSPYPASGCKYREWQMQAITYLSGDYMQKLKNTFNGTSYL